VPGLPKFNYFSHEKEIRRIGEHTSDSYEHRHERPLENFRHLTSRGVWADKQRHNIYFRRLQKEKKREGKLSYKGKQEIRHLSM
jgi:hypothetical protein